MSCDFCTIIQERINQKIQEHLLAAKEAEKATKIRNKVYKEKQAAEDFLRIHQENHLD